MTTEGPPDNREKPKASGQGTLLQQKSLLMLMDGHAMVHRAYHAIQQAMTVRSTGEEVRGVYGFTNAFLRALSDWNPTHCAIAFDMRGPTFRHEMFKEYKAQRPETAPELLAQFPRVRQIMEAFGVPIYEMEGFEGDDVLGTLCHQAEKVGVNTIIITGDTDTLQLVSPSVRVALHYSTQERKVYDGLAVRERYGGLGADNVTDIKALQGDASDNIPGVPGIGAKTAVKLVQQFGSLEGLYEGIDQVTPPRIQQLLRDHKEQAVQGKDLTTIVRDMPIKLDLEAMRFEGFDRDKVVKTLRDLEFSSMLNRIPGGKAPVQGTLLEAGPAPSNLPKVDRHYKVVDTLVTLTAMAEELRSAGGFAFDTETTGLDPMQAELVGLSFSTAPGSAYYVPVGHQDGQQMFLGEVLEELKSILEDPSISKVAHNANFDMMILSNYGIEVQGLDFDTMVAAQLVGYNAIGLKSLAFQVLEEAMTPITQLIGTGRKQVTFDQVAIADAVPYAAADADMTGRLRTVLEPSLEERGAQSVFTEIEIPLVPVLVETQRNGIIVDGEMLQEMSDGLIEQVESLTEAVHHAAGEAFNLNSPQQLSRVLFEKLLPLARLKEMKLPLPKRTKTGYSTDVFVLESLKGAHSVVDNMLDYRQVTKIKSTYLDALPAQVNLKTGRVHTSYNQVGSATGRLSSSDPNLQQIPISTELGRQVRRSFLAQPGWSLLAADYSQVELRILAHLSIDQGLLDAFHRDEDIHSSTASQVYGVALDQVTPEMRRLAKVMNFGIIYGLSAHGMTMQTDIPYEESAAFIQSYLGKYPGIREYVEKTKQGARDKGYVETLSGRRRYLPEISHSNFQVRQAAERMAINMPVQGTAADVIKIAMVSIHKRMHDEGVRSLMLLQVHDELIFETPPEEMDSMKAMLLELMPAAMDLVVPLKVDLKVGLNWGELE